MLSQKDKYYLNIALRIAEASKCIRAKYGSVIVSADGRIVSTGYNGKPRNSANDDICYRIGLENNASKPNCCLHSETNAIIFCTPEERMGATMYVTGVPCTDCALLIAQSGISRVVFLNFANNGHVGNFDFAFAAKYGMTVNWQPVSEEEFK